MSVLSLRTGDASGRLRQLTRSTAGQEPTPPARFGLCCFPHIDAPSLTQQGDGSTNALGIPNLKKRIVVLRNRDKPLNRLDRGFDLSESRERGQRLGLYSGSPNWLQNREHVAFALLEVCCIDVTKRDDVSTSGVSGFDEVLKRCLEPSGIKLRNLQSALPPDAVSRNPTLRPAGNNSNNERGTRSNEGCHGDYGIKLHRRMVHDSMGRQVTNPQPTTHPGSHPVRLRPTHRGAVVVQGVKVERATVRTTLTPWAATARLCLGRRWSGWEPHDARPAPAGTRERCPVHPGV